MAPGAGHDKLDGDVSDDLDDDIDDDLDDEEPAGLRAAVASHLGGSEDDVFIDLCPVEVPGLTVFAAHLSRRSLAGLWDGSRMELDPDVAIQRVTDAWGYDETRPVSPRAVAAAVGMIEGGPGSPFLDERAIQLSGASGDVSPPEEIEIDGAPGVRFWNSTARLAPYPVSYVVVDGAARVDRP